ncbi:MAG: hypothetical protein K6U87_08060 [Firmicutes bacterium]|nr:hypothetical protein [Bacillota bacterium]
MAILAVWRRAVAAARRWRLGMAALAVALGCLALPGAARAAGGPPSIALQGGGAYYLGGLDNPTLSVVVTNPPPLPSSPFAPTWGVSVEEVDSRDPHPMRACLPLGWGLSGGLSWGWNGDVYGCAVADAPVYPQASYGSYIPSQYQTPLSPGDQQQFLAILYGPGGQVLATSPVVTVTWLAPAAIQGISASASSSPLYAGLPASMGVSVNVVMPASDAQLSSWNGSAALSGAVTLWDVTNGAPVEVGTCPWTEFTFGWGWLYPEDDPQAGWGTAGPCSFSVSEPQPGAHTFVAVLAMGGGVAPNAPAAWSTSQPITITWIPWPALTLTASTTSPSPGQTVTLTASAPGLQPGMEVVIQQISQTWQALWIGGGGAVTTQTTTIATCAIGPPAWQVVSWPPNGWPVWGYVPQVQTWYYQEGWLGSNDQTRWTGSACTAPVTQAGGRYTYQAYITYQGAQSPVQSVTVDWSLPIALHLTASPDPAALGQPITLTVTASAPVPPGDWLVISQAPYTFDPWASVDGTPVPTGFAAECQGAGGYQYQWNGWEYTWAPVPGTTTCSGRVTISRTWRGDTTYPSGDFQFQAYIVPSQSNWAWGVGFWFTPEVPAPSTILAQSNVVSALWTNPVPSLSLQAQPNPEMVTGYIVVTATAGGPMPQWVGMDANGDPVTAAITIWDVSTGQAVATCPYGQTAVAGASGPACQAVMTESLPAQAVLQAVIGPPGAGPGAPQVVQTSNPVTVTWTVPYLTALHAAPVELPAGQATELVATVTDPDGQPIPPSQLGPGARVVIRSQTTGRVVASCPVAQLPCTALVRHGRPGTRWYVAELDQGT